MKFYQELLRKILTYGEVSDNRTGIATLSIKTNVVEFDLQRVFPALTLRPLPFKSVMAELLGFIRGVDNAREFRELGTGIWDANANSDGVYRNRWLDNPFRTGEDDLGRIYGVQWRRWQDTQVVSHDSPLFPHLRDTGYEIIGPELRLDGGEVVYLLRKEVDQLAHVIDQLKTNPTSRKMIISAWNVADLNKMALEPCHVLQHYMCSCDPTSPTGYKIDLNLYQRSCDVVLGLPFNIASYATLVHILSRLTGHNVGTFTYITGDTHIYENHTEAVKELLSRSPSECDTELFIADHIQTLGDVEKSSVEDYRLSGYTPNEKLQSPTPMAV